MCVRVCACRVDGNVPSNVCTQYTYVYIYAAKRGWKVRF